MNETNRTTRIDPTYDVLDAETGCLIEGDLIEPDAEFCGSCWSARTKKPHHIVRHGVRVTPRIDGREEV